MKRTLLVFIAALSLACETHHSAPKPVDTIPDVTTPVVINPVDSTCVTCNAELGLVSDSVSAFGTDRDLQNLMFLKPCNNFPINALSNSKAKFRGFLDANAQKYDSNLVVYIGRQGSTLFCYQKGIYNTETPLPIFSASKTITAAVIMSIVESGNLALDDKVSKYIASFQNDKKDITIRQLLTHTSGIVTESTFDTRNNITLSQNIDSIAIRTPLLFAPGTQSHYGSVSFSVASRVAEIVEKKPWAQIFWERIGSKCQMGKAVYSPENVANPATGYGVVCSMNEYLRFLTMMYNKGTYGGVRVLKSSSVDIMERDNTNGVDQTYGLGMTRAEISNKVAEEVVIMSAKGIHGWINRKRNFYGLIFTQAGFDKTIQPNLDFRQLVRYSF
ncbi:serine hydrolase domain-containing protein [Dyadobacter luticola]|uniref:Beta-lactamase family protein n=1 Tax=Dyadobacter luticola TaxID=1979387 RepID=A0A5R9L290_9BACT|nr:serine hydrolase domain-containing protein [Dyadobacter luticola]TLV02497.1 beta-lactamase family protein [Dyadobacter luticola]